MVDTLDNKYIQTSDNAVNNELSAENARFLLSEIAENQDRPSFIRLFNYYAPRLKYFLMRGGYSDELAEELMQETLLTVWRNADKYNPDKAQPGTWIYTIARNKKIDYLRKTQKNTPHPDDLYDLSQDLPIDKMAEKQTSDEILKELANLPEEQSKLLISAFYEDKTHAEIAEQNKLPLGTVKSRIRLGLQKMKEALGNKSLSFDYKNNTTTSSTEQE
ncbi:MAG: RNA polymerase subunit sigma [Alphaproteobacteria bacterium]|nr:RNA polymerase subunit sigma [Alphaproteobacteria bacterium]